MGRFRCLYSVELWHVPGKDQYNIACFLWLVMEPISMVILSNPICKTVDNKLTLQLKIIRIETKRLLSFSDNVERNIQGLYA